MMKPPLVLWSRFILLLELVNLEYHVAGIPLAIAIDHSNTPLIRLGKRKQNRPQCVLTDFIYPT
jgi:hypothetical protein